MIITPEYLLSRLKDKEEAENSPERIKPGETINVELAEFLRIISESDARKLFAPLDSHRNKENLPNHYTIELKCPNCGQVFIKEGEKDEIFRFIYNEVTRVYFNKDFQLQAKDPGNFVFIRNLNVLAKYWHNYENFWVNINEFQLCDSCKIAYLTELKTQFKAYGII